MAVRASETESCGMSSMKNIIMALKFFFLLRFGSSPTTAHSCLPGCLLFSSSTPARISVRLVDVFSSETQNGDEIERSVVGWFLCTFDRKDFYLER